MQWSCCLLGHELEKETGEPFERYSSRITKLLPSFPTDVIEQWLYRHNSDFIKKFTHLPLSSFDFRLSRFSNEDFTLIKLFDRDYEYYLDAGKNLLGDPIIRERGLGHIMLKRGSFPCPVIVFEGFNLHQDYAGENFLAPFHLVEGHRRWAFLRTMIKFSETSMIPALLEEHEVFRVTLRT